jgi:hypothetical protein
VTALETATSGPTHWAGADQRVLPHHDTAGQGGLDLIQADLAQLAAVDLNANARDVATTACPSVAPKFWLTRSTSASLVSVG